MDIKLGVISYGEFAKRIEELKPYLPNNVEILVKDGLFDSALESALKFEKDKMVDVIISAGSNGAYIRNYLKLPYVDVTVTGFDLMLSMKKAMVFSDKIGVITYTKRIEYLSEVSEVLNIKVFERTYDHKEELHGILEELKSLGVNDIIGASLVCESAQNMGMRSYFIYSVDGLMRSISHAIDISITRKKELEKSEELRAMLEFVHEGIIVTDIDSKIKIFNRAAEDITGIKGKDAIGKNVVDVIENTRLDNVIDFNSQELNKLQQIGGRKVLTNRVAISLHDKVIGALATFQSIDHVRKAETSIRNSLMGRGFVAKKNFNDIIGESPRIKSTIKDAKIYSNSDATILIEAETGTGKEIFAQSIHNESKRKNKPFVAINCAAIAPSLLESELFGYEEGAFSGAKKGGRYGVFELANGGTVFLDEIGEIPLEVQTRLLRVLEEKEIFRIGGDKVTNLNIRIIAATNKNLTELIQSNKFRKDLYYRLSILKLKIPPLRNRQTDVPILFKYFLSNFNSNISEKDMEYMINKKFRNYDWPGNIREVRNIAEQIGVLFNNYDCIDDLLDVIDTFYHSNNKIENQEREIIEDALIKSMGNKTKAAELLGIGGQAFGGKLKNMIFKKLICVPKCSEQWERNETLIAKRCRKYN